MLGWALLERIRDGHVTCLGAASGLFSDLVAITPACANVDPVGALALGFIATPSTGTAGLFYGGGLGLLVTQSVATLISMACYAVVTLLIVIPIHRTRGFRVSEKQEAQGIDLAQHAETVYVMSSGTSGPSLKTRGGCCYETYYRFDSTRKI